MAGRNSRDGNAGVREVNGNREERREKSETTREKYIEIITECSGPAERAAGRQAAAFRPTNSLTTCLLLFV